jgi:hypothetical protein
MKAVQTYRRRGMSTSLEFIPFPAPKNAQQELGTIDFSSILGRVHSQQVPNNSMAEAVNALARFAIVTGATVIAFMLAQHGIRIGSGETIQSALKVIGSLSKT